MAVDVVNDDRRPTVSSGRRVGREQIIELTESLAAVGFDSMTQEPIAIRGERLALMRRAWRNPDGFDLEVLALQELDDAGLVAHNVLFDPDDLALALVDLDRRYAAGEGAEHAGGDRRARRGLRRGESSRLRRVGRLPHSRITRSTITRRSGSACSDKQAYREYLVAAFEQVAGLRASSPRHSRSMDSFALGTIPDEGATPTGFEFERDLVVVTRFDDDLRIVEDHLFAPRAVVRGLARSSKRSRPRPFSTPYHAGRERRDAIDGASPELARTRQFESIADLIAEDYVRIDHRTGIPAPTSHGPADFVAMLRATLDVGFDEILNTPLAVHGERLALSRVDVHAADGREIVFLQLHEWDASKLVYAAHYDESALADALAELEERFIAGEGAAHEYEIRRVGDVARAARARDHAAAYRALHTPGCTVTDHRLLSWPTSTVSDVVDEVRADRGISAPRTTVFASLEIRGDAVLVTQDDFLRHARRQRVPQAVPRRDALRRGAHRHHRVLRTRAARRQRVNGSRHLVPRPARRMSTTRSCAT